MAQQTKIEFQNFFWLDINQPDESTLRALQAEHGFHPLDVADCLTPSHRSTIDVYPGYSFLTLLFPHYTHTSREIKAIELNIFISGNYLITIHQEELPTLNEFFNLFRITSDLRDQYPDSSPERLLYEALNKLVASVFPIADHLSADCNTIEEAIFSGRERRMVYEILIIRRNITDTRRIMQVHKNVLKKAGTCFKDSKLYVMKKTDIYFEGLVNQTKEIWDMLENLKERIEALQQTNESQISFRLSDIMRILTIISVITFPITLLAGVFGMNTVHAMPFVNNPDGFWYVIGLMIAIAASMLVIFKKNGWL